MPFDDFPFLFIQRSRLLHDLVGNADLPHVMHGRCVENQLGVLFIKTDDQRQDFAVVTQALNMRTGLFILVPGRQGQADHGIRIGFFEFTSFLLLGRIGRFQILGIGLQLLVRCFQFVRLFAFTRQQGLQVLGI